MNFLKLCVVLFSLLAVAFAISREELKDAVRKPELVKQLNWIEKFWKKTQAFHASSQNGDMSLACGLCGIAINEVEGFIAENKSVSEIQQLLTDDICNNLNGLMKLGCLAIVSELPLVIGNIENRWSVSAVCIDLGLCTVPFDEPSDPQDLPHYTINLDQDPKTRWQEVCSNATFKQNAQFLYQVVTSLLPNNGEYLNDIGEAINAAISSEYAQEIQGCAEVLDIPYGWVTLFNLGYEVSDACTSIVAQTNDGKILHGRNLDFWAGIGLTGQLKNMSFIGDFQKGGKTVFIGNAFAGYVGILSGIKPGGFSITINTRFYPDGIGEMFYEVVAAILEKNASLVAFLSRDVLTNENDFDAALDNLSNEELIADVYYTMAGTKPGEGVVISRNRENATDVWRLDADNGRWYEVETNYDHWEQPPWFDDRLTPANAAMDAMGRNNLTLDGLFQVLSVKPVFNIQTTYTILACPADGTWYTYNRYCPYPCVE